MDMDTSKVTFVFVSPTNCIGTDPEIQKIRDWLAWSIFNIFFAWGGGFLPFIFSFICRSKKRNNDVNRAQTMSKLALIFNILATLSGIFCWILVIVLLISYYNRPSDLEQMMDINNIE